MEQLPPELYKTIVSYVTTSDLFTLSRTSLAFQRAAEARIYEIVAFRDPHSTILACNALLARDATRAAYVKRLILWQDPRRMLPRSNFATVSNQLWGAVQAVLRRAPNIEYLVVHDPHMTHSWILDHPEIVFQAREVNIRLGWDAHVVAFLQGQRKLQTLIVGPEAAANEDGPLPQFSTADALHTLQVFSGPLLIVAELLACPLTRLQIMLDKDTVPLLPVIVGDLGKMMPTLRKLQLLHAPEEALPETLDLIETAVFAPELRYLGALPLPVPMMGDWHAIQRCLMKLPKLEVIEFDVSHWEPQPYDLLLRMVLLDLQIYNSHFSQVNFWLAQRRCVWFSRDGTEWALMHPAGRYGGQDLLWRS